MTKDYALFLLNQLCVGASVEAMPIIPQSELSQALSVAIKALEQQSCDDAISRQAVINRIANTCFWLSPDNWEELIKCINSISPVTPQQKIGHWEVDEDRIYTCNQCNKRNLWHSLFCPNCGAKMEDTE